MIFRDTYTESQIEVLVNPFVTAYLNDAMEQLEVQIASAKISLSKLSSPQLYYILSVTILHQVSIAQNTQRLFAWETIRKRHKPTVLCFPYILWSLPG